MSNNFIDFKIDSEIETIVQSVLDYIIEVSIGIVTFDASVSEYYYFCPHCFGMIITHERDMRCCIFRHGAINGHPIPPHLSRNLCELMMKQSGSQGCFKPYRIYNEHKFVEKCDYI